jgi:two-component system, cell cycle sensor histidine kinase and response regulator CckA
MSASRSAVAGNAMSEGALIQAYLEQSTTGRGNKTILVVEENAAARDMLSGGLKGEGFRVLTAANGMEALHLAERHTGRIDALITGTDLAEFDGIELALLVKTARPQVRVLFLAGDIPGERDAADAMVPGSLFVERPFGADQITRALRELLGKPEVILDLRG